MGLRKTISVFVMTAVMLCAGSQLFAQMPKDQVEKMAKLTGLSESEVKTTGLKLDELLMAYCIAKTTGNSLSSIVSVRKANWKETENAADIWKPVYDKLSIQGDKAGEINTLYQSLRGDILKEKFQKADYGTMKKDKVAEIIANKTSISKGSIMDHGFGSGLPVQDILMAAVIAAQTGNSFSEVARLRKEGSTDFTVVYQKYNIAYDKQQEISARYNEHLEAVQRAANTEKRQKQGLTRDMQSHSASISSITGMDKEKILNYYRQGFSEGDIIRACAISNKTGADLYNIMRILDEDGWSKVNSSYLSSNIMGEVDAIVGAINNKINPPAQ